MQILNIQPGTNEWLALRSKYSTASEAPIMMGSRPNVSRSELLRMKATGDEQQFSEWVKDVLFERGHEVERLARPIVEDNIKQELCPTVALNDDGDLLASFDGLTFDGSLVWECKQWSEEKAKYVRAGKVPLIDYWQLVQQLAVSGAPRLLYVLSDGTKEKTIGVYLKRNEKDIQKLKSAWKQFDDDLANYQHVETKAEVTGIAPESLPALHIQVTGEVTASNLDEFKTRAIEVFNNINTDLQTDADFANADKTIKWCQEIEKKLDSAKDHALSQTASIDELFKAIDAIKEIARAKRLDLDKLVTQRKKDVRGEILTEGQTAWREHIAVLNKTLGGKVLLPAIQIDFAGAMKNKRTVASLKNAVSDELARAKIEANELADKIKLNLITLDTHSAGYESLFADVQALAVKENDDLLNVIKLRIAEQKQKDADNLEAEREKIRLEEEAKAQATIDAEQKAKLEEYQKSQIAADHKLKAEQSGKVADEGLKSIVSAIDNEVQKRQTSRTPMPGGSSRPTDQQIIEVLALHYRVHEQVVIGWLANMDLDQLSEVIGI